MTTVNVYLNFNGNCLEAFNFYRSVFGGDYPYVGTYGEMPAQEGMPPVQEVDRNKIMHISLPISKETTIMGADVVEGMGAPLTVGNNFAISVLADNIEKGEEIFNNLSEGGMVTMPLNKTFWGAYFGMLIDPFGINWMINVDLH